MSNKQVLEVETVMRPLLSKEPGIPAYIQVHVRPFPIFGSDGGFQTSYRLESYIQLSILPDKLRDQVRTYIQSIMKV